MPSQAVSAFHKERHVELVANSETGNTDLKKGPGLHALSRSLCHEVHVCPGRKNFLALPLRCRSVTFGV